MLIQSNVNDRIENGITTPDKVRQWMQETLAPIFSDTDRQLVFSGYSWYIRNYGEEIEFFQER
jgi:hypothetical protein